MKQNNLEKLFIKFGKWLEGRLKDIDHKIDHILFRLRYEDPRIYRPKDVNELDQDTEDDLRDI